MPKFHDWCDEQCDECDERLARIADLRQQADLLAQFPQEAVEELLSIQYHERGE